MKKHKKFLTNKPNTSTAITHKILKTNKT